MDKKYNGSSVIYGKKTFDFVICYLVILHSDLDLVINFKLLQTTLKLPLFETFLPLNVIECAEALKLNSFWLLFV